MIDKNKVFETSVLIISLIIVFVSLAYISAYNIQWDNIAYDGAAKSNLNLSNVYEMRPPLLIFFFYITALIGLSTPLSIIILILLTLGLYTFITSKLCKLLELDFTTTLISTFSLGVMLYALHSGSDFLAITMYLFAIYQIINKRQAGVYLALAFMLRFNYLILILSLALDRKNLLKNIGGFLIILMPWFIYNKWKFDNYFAPIIQNHYENSLLTNLYSLSHLEPYLTNLIILLVLGITIALYSKKVTLSDNIKKFSFGILIIVITSFISYYLFSAGKDRLLMPISVVIAFAIGYIIATLKQDYVKTITLLVLSLMILINASVIYYTYENNPINYFNNQISVIEDYKECKTLSNYSLLLRYYNLDSREIPQSGEDFNIVSQNKVIIIFNNLYRPDYLKEHDLNKINDTISIINNGCIKAERNPNYTNANDYCNNIANNHLKQFCYVVN